MLNSNNATENYGRRWARIRFRGDLYSQESIFPLVRFCYRGGVLATRFNANGDILCFERR